MDYPNITLKITGDLAAIEFHSDENTVKTVTTASSKINDLLLRAAETVKFDSDIEHIWQIIRTGDEQVVQFAPLDAEVEDLELGYLLKEVEAIAAEHTATLAPQANADVVAALNDYWCMDVLASLLDEIYSVLIARTLHTASEMGIGSIVLADERKEARLAEKMSKELAVLGIELVVA